jgi:hypothetical protein
MERCPTCQARLKQDPICPRCRTDLSWLFRIESQAAARLRQAIGLLAAGEEAQALAVVEASLRLQRTPIGMALHGYLTHLAAPPSVAETPSAPGLKAQDASGQPWAKEKNNAFLADLLARLRGWLRAH